MNTKRIKSAVERAVQQASFSLRQDVHRLLRRAYLQEHNKKAKKALGWILENAKVAQSQKLALCQDTGLPIVFIEIGRDTKFSSSLLKAVKQGVEDGYRKNYLRASSVDPFKRTNPSYRGLIHHIDFSPKPDELTITVFPKGFGSENKSQLKMFNPTASRDEIEEFIVEAAKHAGAESCPHFVVGLGIRRFL
ncbi:MAG: fumarate hydratase [Candidatus Omnitrophota bacterium]|nr:MAG: fumarate hydratase [Candidatus Omnitrophota bacterium]